MAFQPPQSRRQLQPIVPPRRQIPVDQIIAIKGQNPLATGIDTAGNTLGNAVLRRAQLQMQGQQIAQLAAMTGQQVPTGMTGLDPDTYIKALTAKATMEKDATDRALLLQALKNQGTANAAQIAATGRINQKQFVGLDANGQPIVMDKLGNFSSTSAPGGGTILSKTSTTPTSQTRSTAEFANTLLPHIQSLRDLISQADAKGYIGPAAGRIYGDFLAGKVGSTGNPDADALLGRLRATDSLMKTGAMKVHFGSRGGQQMYDHFSDLLNTGKQSAAMLNGSLDGIQEFMQGYANAGMPRGAAPKALSSKSKAIDLGNGFSYTVNP